MQESRFGEKFNLNKLADRSIIQDKYLRKDKMDDTIKGDEENMDDQKMAKNLSIMKLKKKQ